MQTKPAKALTVDTFSSLPSDAEDGTLGITKDTSFLYYYSAGSWSSVRLTP